MIQGPGTYPRGKYMKGAPLRLAPALLANIIGNCDKFYFMCKFKV